MKKQIEIHSSITFFIAILLSTITVIAQNTKVVFNYTGADQTWTVPSGAGTSITVKAWGAGGGGGGATNDFNDNGGGGGFTYGTITVTPGQVLTIIVGGGGGIGEGLGAYGGGGSKWGGDGGRGGGRSAIRNASGAELLTAGGGGGGGRAPDGSLTGGNGGGGLLGEDVAWFPYSGNPGTFSNGGAAGYREEDGGLYGGEPGGQFYGGNAGIYDDGGNGSGGGGYYGGGSGTDYGDGAGGGGSAYLSETGYTTGASGRLPSNLSDVDYFGIAGYGGLKGQGGQGGLVVISYECAGTWIDYFADLDGDHYAGDGPFTFCTDGSTPQLYITPNESNGPDCNDNDATVFVNGSYYTDLDGDHYVGDGPFTVCSNGSAPHLYLDLSQSNGADCDDNDATVFVNGSYYTDLDGDHYIGDGPFTVCSNGSAPHLYLDLSQSNGADCNDNDPTIFVNGNYYSDLDGDHYAGDGPFTICSDGNAPHLYISDFQSNGADCNDNDATVFHNGSYYADLDGDHYAGAGPYIFCTNGTAPHLYIEDYQSNGADCNDNDGTVFHSGSYYADLDGDHYAGAGPYIFCTNGTAPHLYIEDYQSNGNDCNDNNGAIYPGATEVCGNLIDDDCDALVDETCCTIPTGLFTSGITSSSAILNWNQIESAISYKIQYKKNQNGTWSSVTVSAPASSYILTGLESSKKYSWKIRSICNSDKSSFSSQVGFKTTALKEGEDLTQNYTDKVNINVFPNPTQCNFTVNMNLENEMDCESTIQLINSIGQLIYVTSSEIKDGILHQEIKVGVDLADGNYFIRVTVNDQTYMGKILIQR